MLALAPRTSGAARRGDELDERGQRVRRPGRPRADGAVLPARRPGRRRGGGRRGAGARPRCRVLRYYMLITAPTAAAAPPLTGGPLDAPAGRRLLPRPLRRAGRRPCRRWMRAWSQPWRLGAADIGEPDRPSSSRRHYARRAGWRARRSRSVGPQVLINAGRRDEASPRSRTAAAPRAPAARSSAGAREPGRGRSRSTWTAIPPRHAPCSTACGSASRRAGSGYLAEEVDSSRLRAPARGLTDAALGAPATGGRSMRRADEAGAARPPAVYLAEAEWRAGNEDAADRAADARSRRPPPGLQPPAPAGAVRVPRRRVAADRRRAGRRLAVARARPVAGRPGHRIGASVGDVVAAAGRVRRWR